jgi:hypothetical protein
MSTAGAEDTMVRIVLLRATDKAPSAPWWHGWCYYSNLNTRYNWVHPWWQLGQLRQATMMVRSTATSVVSTAAGERRDES